MTQPFLIAAPRVGLERDIEPWILPNDAYPELDDCYLWRGRIKRKQGYNLLGRLQRIVASPAPGSFTVSFTLEGVSALPPLTPLTPFQSHFTWNGVIYTDDGMGTFNFTTGGVGSTINYNTGDVTLNLLLATAGATTVAYFSGLPVMGLPSLVQISTNQSAVPAILIAFDPKFSYYFNNSTQVFTDASFYKGGPAFTWTGDDADFFWSTNYANALWSTNFQPGFNPNPISSVGGTGDGIRWFDQNLSGWVNFLPSIDTLGTPTKLQGALIIVAYKSRLIVFNTWEGDSYINGKNFPQRARWCSIGTPFYSLPLPANWNGSFVANTWVTDPAVVNTAGFVDAPTQEQIISAQFLKDTLIVYFENSTWQLAYTANELLPFQWVKINTELGALSTFSEIPFDDVVLGVGGVGIHACNTYAVDRIDQRIPDEVFAVPNVNFDRERIYGVRDYFTQLVYWALPYQGANLDEADMPPPAVSLRYPNKILAYNYIDKSFSFFNDSFTAFGYYQRGNTLTWGNTKTQWQATLFKWNDAESVQAFPFVVAGNQEGFVEVFNPEEVANDQSLMISAITGTTITALNHNLFVNNVISIVNNGTLIGSFDIINIVDKDSFNVSVAPVFVFTGDAVITVIPGFNVYTKKFSPFIEEGSQVRINYLDLYVDRTESGQFEILLYQDEDTSQPTNLAGPFAEQTIVSTFPESTYTNSPDTLPFKNAKLWKRIYFDNVSQEFQFQFHLSTEQLKTPNIANSAITIHGMILWLQKAGRLINV